MYLVTQDQKIKVLFTEITTLTLNAKWTNTKNEVLGIEVITPAATYYLGCKTRNLREYILGEYADETEARKSLNDLIEYIKKLPVDSWTDDSEYEIGTGAVTPPDEGNDPPDKPVDPPTEPDEPDNPPIDPDDPPVDPPIEDQPATFIAANLTAVEGEVGPAFGHATTYTVEANPEDPMQAILTAVDLEKTVNSLGSEDYWVGVGVLKQDGASYNWGFGAKPETVEYRNLDRTQSDGDVKYTTLYWSSDDVDQPWSETDGYISVKVGEEVTDYTVKFNVQVV